MQTQNKKHNTEFSKDETLCIKGIAILLMLFHHIFYGPERWPALPIDFSPFSQAQVVYIAKFFKICVGMFVFMTGYGMYVSAAHGKSGTHNPVHYTVRRYLALMLGYWFVFFTLQLVTLPTGRFQVVYGEGFKAAVYFSIDALGLAHLYKTPIYCSTWWYMSLAILLIVIFPVAFTAIRKYRGIALLLAILLPTALKLPMTDLARWLFAYLLGMYCADYNLLARAKDGFRPLAIPLKAILFLGALGGLVALVYIRQEPTIGKKFIPIWDGLVPAYLIFMSSIFILWHDPVAVLLQFLGKHSMNMFLLHTFFYQIYFKQFMYSFTSMWLDYLVLILVSVAASVLLETIKKVVQYRRLTTRVTNALIERLSFS